MQDRMHLDWRIFVFLICSVLSINTAWALAERQDSSLTHTEKTWLDAHPTIRVAFDGFFPPYSFINDNNELEGFSVDVFRQLEKQLGVRFEIYPKHEWKGLYEAAKLRKLDVVATMVNREERAEWFKFTAPYIEKSLVIITDADNTNIQHRSDLKNKRIALVKDYQYAKTVVEQFPNASPVYTDTIVDAFNAVTFGDADAAIAFLGAGHFYRTKYLMSNLKYAAIFDKYGSPESIAVRNDWPELASILDKALTNIPEAQMQALKEKWLPVDYMNEMVEINLTDAEKQWIKEHPTIRLGVDPEFAPFEFIENDRYSGMASDYIRLLNQRLNLNMEVVEGLSWKQVIEKARQRELDVLPAVGMTEERKQYLNFTKPYLNFHRVIVTHDESPFIVDLRDLRKRKVAVQVNSSHHGYVMEHSDITPVTYPTLKEALFALSGGEVDAFVGNVASTTYWIRKLNLTNLKVAAPVSREVQSLHFAVRKDWPELVGILEKGLGSITAEQQKAISEKWMSVQYGYDLDIALVWKIVGILFAIVVLVFFWNLSLKRKVNQQTNELMRSAHYDFLTGLPNRFLIEDRLTQQINNARQTHTNVAVISIDLDDFKKINDSFGHNAGDTVLSEVTSRLNSVVKEGDSLGRIGGDRFLLIYSDFTESTDAAAKAQDVVDCFIKAFSFDQRDFNLSASIGIAIYPQDGRDSAELIKHAGSATSHAKESSRQSYAFYTANLNEKVSRRLQIEQQLRGAMDRGEFSLVYQPKIDAATLDIVSFEALIRWNNEALGNVSPVEFIPVAEKSEVIEQIGLFVVRESLNCLAKWQRQFNRPFKMAVNFSPSQFKSRELVADVKHSIEYAQVKYEDLEIEITEGILLGGFPDTEFILNKLESLGVRLAMDDFGTGYSSMSYLRKFKFDTLKIDREFINDLPDNDAVCKLVVATIVMAKGLDMEVVAEGVETEAQRDFLIRKQCDLLQGWLLGKPAAAEDITAILQSSREQRSAG